MSLKSRLFQLSALGIAATTLFADAKDKKENNVIPSDRMTAPATIPSHSAKQSNAPEKTQNTPPTLASEKITNQIQATPQNNTSDKSSIKTTPSVSRPMNKAELEQFMQTQEYKNWRDNLAKKWLLGMSGSVSEGFCPWGYMCTKNKLTIGHGIAETSGKDFSTFALYFEDGSKMKEEQVDDYFKQVKKKSPTKRNAGRVAHSIELQGATSKIAGMRYEDSISESTQTVRNFIDIFYRRAYLERGIDFMKEPYAVQMLATDISYQVGPDNFVSKWHNFMNAVKNKQYSKLINQVSTKERKDGKHNKARLNAKQLLAKLAVSQAQKDHTKSAELVRELYKIGANIYNLKYRGGHEPETIKNRLKKRDVGGFPADIQKMFNIDKDGKKVKKAKKQKSNAPLVNKVKKTKNQKVRKNKKQRKNNTAVQKRRRGGGR